MGMKSIGIRHALLMGAAAFGFGAAAATVAQPAYAQQATRSYDIPSQNLDDALREFGRQTGRDVLFTPDSVANKHSAGVRGELTEHDALQALLSGSGLRFEQTASGGYAVQDPNSPTRLGDASGAAPSDDGATAEILVIGRRTLNTDIRRSEDDPQPYVVFDAQQIERSQSSNLEQFLRSRLPMNTEAQANNQLGNNRDNSNRSQINLRGLGANQTLILVDGRRVPRTLATGSSPSQGDINGIPLSAIERIEVLPTTAGGIYGGGAVGGVINIVLKRDYQGIDLSTEYDGTFRGGGETLREDLTGGWSPNGGDTQVTFFASHSSSDPLYARDNNLSQRGRSRYIANAPPGSTLDFSGSTPNIQSADGSDLVLDNGTDLGSDHTFVPTGYTGAASDNGVALAGNAGHYNMALSGDDYGRFATLLNNPTVTSGDLSFRQRFGSSIEAFADFSILDNSSESRWGSGFNNGVILADAPTNPFQQDILVYFPDIGLDRPAKDDTQTASATGGLIGRWAGWTGTVEYGWSRVRTRTSTTETPITFDAFDDLATGALDVLRDVEAHPIDFSPYILPYPDYREDYSTVQHLASARVAGSPFVLPGGPATLTALLEQRTEDAPLSTFTRTPYNGLSQYRPPRSQSVNSAYVELRNPLVAEANAIPLVRELELDVSVRNDRYDTRAPSPALINLDGNPPPTITYSSSRVESTNYTVALRWSPIRDLTLRSSYSTGFLPAAIDQIASSTFVGHTFQRIRDPLRGNQFVGTSAPFVFISGGNPDLTPEESRSFSWGAIVTPRLIPGLRFSADFSRIEKTNEIGFVSSQFIVDNESNYPDRIVRGPNLPTDAPGWAGPITSINSTFLNIANSRVEAWDFQADYNVDTSDFGSFHLYAVATHETVFHRQLLPTIPGYDAVGLHDGPLEWRGNVGVDWSLGSWDLSWNTQFYDGYSLRYGNPASLNTGALQIERQGTDRIPSQNYSDLYFRYNFDRNHEGILHGTSIAFGIQNIFDQEPPVIADLTSPYSTYGDPRLRRFTLRLTKHFGE